MKFKYLFLVVLMTVLAGCGDSELYASVSLSEAETLVLDSNNSKYKLAIKQSVKSEDFAESNDRISRIGVTSHHLPVASEFIGEFYAKFLNDQNKEVKNIFVIGPDHPEKCSGVFSTGKVDYDTSFGRLESNKSIVGEIVKSDLINEEPECLEREHSIGVHADYIDYILPDAEIIPIVVSSSATLEESRKIADIMRRFYKNSLFIISVDFNHFRTLSQAQVYDQETIDAIEAMNVDDLQIDHVDSPPSLIIGVELAKKFKAEPRIFGYTNSYEYTGQYGNTTSYFNVLFEESVVITEPVEETQSE